MLFIKKSFMPLIIDRKVIAVITRIIRKNFPEISEREAVFMANVALADFKNFLKVKESLQGETYVNDIVNEKLEGMLRKKSIDKELKDWLVLWLEKWRERVKIVFSEKELKKYSSRDNSNLELSLNRMINSIRYWNELKELTIGSLIRNNEICFTDLTAENILKAEIQKIYLRIKEKRKVIDILNKNPLFLLNSIINRVKELKKTNGPAIVIKLDIKSILANTDDLEERYF